MENPFPIGTRVAVFRSDETTFIGYGVIDAYVPLREIPDTLVVADTRAIGQQEQGKKEHHEFMAELLGLNDWPIPRIQLEDGKITYGFVCYFVLRDEHEAIQNN